MKKNILVSTFVMCLMLVLVGCAAPAMSNDEIIEKAADILSEQGFDLYAALNNSGNEVEPSQDAMPTLPQKTESASSTTKSEPPNTPEQPTEIVSDIGTRKNPVPLGQVLTGSLSTYGDPLCNFEMSIIEVVRGDDAWKMIYKANRFNDEPSDSQEYIVAKVRVKNTADLTEKDEALKISKYDFDLASSNDSISKNQPSIVVPDPELSLTLYEGSEDEGYIAFLVNKSDDNPKAVFADSFWLLLQ